MLEDDHNRECILKQEGLCFLCELQTYIRRASESPCTFSPANAISSIDPDLLKDAKQEDAHEFMRLAIEKMQSICLEEYGGEKLVAPSSQETTLIQYTFGGHLLSQVTCTRCNMVSDRYESMMDLTVEIHGEAESLEECLNQFTAREWLDGDNKYKCDGCNDYVKAKKRLTVHQAPNILTIALKRFQNGRFGKLNKRITFPEILNLSPYMSGHTDGTDLYSLYAVVVHLDVSNASYYGHYVCYTKDYKGSWYKIDDHKVMHVEVKEVLRQGAYMLLYNRVKARKYRFFNHLEPGNKNQSSEPGSIPSSISASADDGRISSTTALQSNIMFTAVEESKLEDTNPATSQSSDVQKEMVSGSMEDVAFKVNSSLLSNEVVDVPNDDNEENLELEKVLEVQNKSPKDECALVSVVLDKLSTAPTRAMHSDSSEVTSFSDVDMEQCNRLLCPSSGCHADEPSGCAETINSNKSQEVSSSDFADGALGVDGIAPVGRIANGHQRKPKPFLSPGFLIAPARKKSLCVEDLIKERVVLSPKVNGYSDGHLVPKSADYDPKSNQDMISSSSLFTKDRLPSPPMSSVSSGFGDKLDRAAHPGSKTTPSASHHQIGCLDDDWLETSIWTGQIPFLKKSNGIHEDSYGAGTITKDEHEGFFNSSYSCTGGQLQFMSKLNNQGIINGQMD